MSPMIKERMNTLLYFLLNEIFDKFDAIALKKLYNLDVSYAFNRKEIKDHGEKGAIVGHQLKSGENVLLIEDVTTAGTSIREIIPILRAHAEVKLVGLIVSVDRMEKGKTPKGALAELREEYNMPTVAIVNLDEIITYLYNREIDGRIIINDDLLSKIKAYRNQYGASE